MATITTRPFSPRPLAAVRAIACVLTLGGCGDDDTTPSAEAVDAASDAAVSSAESRGSSSNDESRQSTSTDSGVDNSCGEIMTACQGKDDADGLGNLCLRVGDSDDPEQCSALHDSCLTYCQTGSYPERDGGVVGPEQCDQVGDTSHDFDKGNGLAHLCHETGHQGNVVWCTALYDACAALCHFDPSTPTEQEIPDASDASTSDGGSPDASTSDGSVTSRDAEL